MTKPFTSAPGKEVQRRPLRVIGLPASGHAYQDCFYEALAQQGVVVVQGYFTGGWLLRNLRAGDVAHLHWPSFFYASESSLQSIAGLVRYALFLVMIRARGARLAWTAHNLYPHRRTKVPGGDWFARWLITRLSDHVFVHGKRACDTVSSAFKLPPSKIVTIPHGHWIGHFPNELDRSLAREKLKIDKHARVFLSFGAQEPYKNIPLLLRAFERAREEHEQLWIVGRSKDQKLREEIRRLAESIPGVHIVEQYIDDSEIQNYMAVADMAVLPYRDGLTSGAAMLALSFGVPVLAPRVACFIDAVSDDCGLLYDAHGSDDELALAQAMQASRRVVFDVEKIYAHARRSCWADAAKRFAGKF